MRVKGRWKYLYRAIDKEGATLDFYLADRRNAKAAKRFSGQGTAAQPQLDAAGDEHQQEDAAYGEAIAELKRREEHAAERHPAPTGEVPSTTGWRAAAR